MNLIGTVVEESAWNALFAGVSFVSGYVYGAIGNADRMLFAKANAISQLAHAIFYRLNYFITGGEEGDYKKNYLFNQMIISAAGGVIEIVAFRKLNLIATTGTVIIGVMTTLVTLHSLIPFVGSLLSYTKIVED